MDLRLHNSEAALQTLQTLLISLETQRQRLDGFETTLGSFSERITSLETHLLMLRAQLAGHGASVKT
jgi:exonuclease VII small subunit